MVYTSKIMSKLKFKNVLITGGAGYVGSALVPSMLKKGYKVTVYDLYIYGDVFFNLRNNPNLIQIKADIRNKEKLIKASRGIDAIIHLACISNDPSYELDPALGKSINYDAFFNVLKAVKKNNIKRIIYASTSSVYGIKKKRDVKERTICQPLTDYSKYKLKCEKALLEFGKRYDIEHVIVRPATVCGYAQRMRLDLVVNILVINALVNRKIKIFSRKQLRPNINIKDMVKVYELFLSAPNEKINGQVFNAGYQNYSVEELAKIVKKAINDPQINLEFVPTDDIRSYHINSDKIKDVLRFKPKYRIEDAVKSIAHAYKKGLIINGLENPLYCNIKMMQKIKLK